MPKKIGFSGWLYMIGFFGAILLGLLEGIGIDTLVGATWIPILLVLVGIFIGLFNVTTNESNGVILAAVGLGAASGLIVVIPGFGGILDTVLSKVAFLSLAVVVPVAFKELWSKLK